MNDEGTLENMLGKVDKTTNFLKTGRADEDWSRYYPNILPITRQSQLAGELPRKAYASDTYTDKKKIWIYNRIDCKYLFQLQYNASMHPDKIY